MSLDKEGLLAVLHTQQGLLKRMSDLGEDILRAAGEEDAVQRVMTLSDTRKEVFEQLREVMSPEDLRLAALLDHPDPEIRDAAGQVKDQFEAVMEQDRRLQQTFVNLLGKVGDTLLGLQQSLKVEKTYRQGGGTPDGVFFDRRR
ncbi:hypothetical protein [Kyrpidia tusciae]|uniref:FlgN family protein n=1 Tax=Kyrpidia tusciae (strain DSM 2912 / NBRC 15312 / T2) TaxID=562970 RepID=D5WUZ4_KYRT2|nr:hypothetical protein [Kyrpidia tusciae]ADG07466.1 hypothetical protein Btus_2822 [Kyrpidia tusciae DSM 2912]